MSKRICIIGSGASGITCIKECLEVGFEIVCYEKGGYAGGLWQYHDSDEDGIASVMRSTIINSSKEMSAYSDFPPPKDLPNYCHNSLMIKYLLSYAKKHGVEQYVKFNHEVLKVVPNEDYESTGRWKVTARNMKTDQTVTDVFDGVMVATGHHVKPMRPKLKGEEKFKGKIIHTHSYKKPNGFEEQNIAVIGVGNSGGDAAVELSHVGKSVYLSTRRGVWMLWRVGPSGEPFDSTYLRRFWDYLFKITPYDLTNSMAENMLNSRFDHEKYGIKPNHRLFGQHPMVNDALPNRILSGTVIIKGDVKEFTENGILFVGDEKETPLDSVILATGYEVCFPFLDDSILWSRDNQVELYKYMFNPKLRHPETLVFIGLIQAVGPAIPVSEMQARWYTHLMTGKSKLPPPSVMMKDIKRKREEMAKRYFPGPRHTMQIDWIPFLDELAEQFGARPRMLKYFFTDFPLWWQLMFGPCYPYQWRLDGPGRWEGARRAILEGQERIDNAFSRPAKTAISSGQANGHTANGGSHKPTFLSATKSQLMSFIFVLLSYFPYLIRGSKYVAIGLCGFLFAARLFPSLFKSITDALTHNYFHSR